MNQRISQLTETLTRKPGASQKLLRDVINTLKVEPPSDYIEFMLESNGAEGFLYNNGYLMIEAVEQLLPCNEPYGLGSAGPGFVCFGSNGASTLFAFDTKKEPVTIVQIDAVSMDTGPVKLLGNTFLEFLESFNRE